MEQITAIVNGHHFIQYHHEIYPQNEMLKLGRDFDQWMELRRTVRDFSDKSIPKELIEELLLTASTAPSGATSSHGLFVL